MDIFQVSQNGFDALTKHIDGKADKVLMRDMHVMLMTPVIEHSGQQFAVLQLAELKMRKDQTRAIQLAKSFSG